MRIRVGFTWCSVLVLSLVVASDARAQAQPQAQGDSFMSRLVVDFGLGLDSSLNGNVNSGAIGRLEGLATAILPNSFGDVYGNGIQLRAGVGYQLDRESELRGVLIFQSADADLVRLGDIGPSSLYAQYSDYQSTSLDLGYRRYVPIPVAYLRPYAEATIGIGFIDRINAQFAAPQANVVLDSEDFYDQTAAFTWSIGAGVLFRLNDRLDLSGQFGLRRVSGLAEVDQFEGTGLDEVNNDSARLTFPFIVGLRIKFP